MPVYSELWLLVPTGYAERVSEATCRALDLCDIVEPSCQVTDTDLSDTLLCAAFTKTYAEIACLLYDTYGAVVEDRFVLDDVVFRLLFLLLRAAPQALFYWPLR